MYFDVCKDGSNNDDSEEEHDKGECITFYTFIDAIIIALQEVHNLKEIPDDITDNEVARRIHMMCSLFRGIIQFKLSREFKNEFDKINLKLWIVNAIASVFDTTKM